MSDLIVGIDLGTTNSEVAAYVNGQVKVLGPTQDKMLPSCVGVSPNGELLVGETARNQQLIYPERTVRSIKRKMGGSDAVTLGDKTFTPPEVSALILRELKEWARGALGQEVSRAVITVPAYFSDVQRTATHEAGDLAGLDVVRILNEPTAASLAYGCSDDSRRTVMVYDLGGGTFDVSIVTMEGAVTEVLASHGNNQLGGDDFDNLLLAHLEHEFHKQHGVWTHNHPAAHARLRWAAEAAKKKLSFEPYAQVREEVLVTHNDKPLHLDVEVSREEYEQMILPLVESTLDSVSKALEDAKKKPRDISTILLVGGSTRTPLISRLLHERTGLEPRQDVQPDLCVALGAGVLASRLAGRDVDRILVDVSPYSFGPSFIGERGGVPYPYCYRPVIQRNSPLPVTRTESYSTSHPHQTEVDLEIFQGDDEDALKNLLVGQFRINNLTSLYEPNEVLCRMSLDLDGILHVTAIEKLTGKSKHVTIANALQAKSDEEIAAARIRLEELYSARASVLDGEELIEVDIEAMASKSEIAVDQSSTLPATSANDDRGNGHGSARGDEGWIERRREAVELIQRSRRLLDTMHAEDKEEAASLQNKIESAVSSHDVGSLVEATKILKELLFFVEGT